MFDVICLADLSVPASWQQGRVLTIGHIRDFQEQTLNLNSPNGSRLY
jgi:hypothetical protein